MRMGWGAGLWAVLSFCAAPAALAQTTGSVGELTMQGRPAAISGTDCRYLVQHHPDPGVAYTPGVDVHGKPVAPADLPGGAQWQLPPVVEFTLVVNPFNAQGSASPSAQARQFVNTQLPVAHVSVDLRTGQVLLDGKPVDGGTADAVVAACRKQGAR